jgi:hypothetical protein
MTFGDRQNNPVVAAVASLKTYDVSPYHTDRLRRRCHALLQAQPGQHESVRMVTAASFRRVIAPALGGAWCLAYLVEIIRRAATMHGF